MMFDWGGGLIEETIVKGFCEKAIMTSNITLYSLSMDGDVVLFITGCW